MKFVLRLAEPIHNGHHGVALFTADRQIVWGWAADGLELEAGDIELTSTFPMLPLRPGPYQWQVSIWEDEELLDMWDCTPEMTIATEVHQHRLDEWNGIMNLPSRFTAKALQNRVPERTRTP